MSDCKVGIVTLHVLVNSESVVSSLNEITQAAKIHPTTVDIYASFQAVRPSFQEKVETGVYDHDGSFMDEIGSCATNVVVDHYGNTESSA